MKCIVVRVPVPVFIPGIVEDLINAPSMIAEMALLSWLKNNWK